MAYRIIPCKECRKRRRKCARTSIYNACNRCERLGRECIYSDEEPDSTQNDQDLFHLQKQIEEMNFLLEDMETQIKSLRPYNPNSGIDNHNNNEDKQLTAKNSIYDNNNKLWKLSFHNGNLRIETGIRSINDLLMQCLPIQYLSPFQSSSSTNGDDMTIQFNSGKTIRFLPLTIKLMTKCITQSYNPTPFLLPTASNSHSIHSIIGELINIYFQCRNKNKPLIHEKTFMQHYRETISPFDSLICLSICCSVCAIPCNHISNDPYKSRQLADFFYDLAKTKLMNQFDEPSKRLENLISINLLNDYMLSVLKLEDFKNLVLIGCCICLDLEPWFESTMEQGNTVERALYSRHFMMIFFSQALLSLITNGPMQILKMSHPELLLIDDEPKETADFVCIQNYMIKLFNNSYLSNIKFQTRDLLKGGPFSLKFESIVPLDDVFKEWWKDVPSKYRICDNWWDLEETKTAIDQCEDDKNLTLFNHFLSFMIDVYSAFLQPNALGTSNDHFLSAVQNLALRRSLHCCQLLSHSQFKTVVLSDILSCQTILGISDQLFNTIDALITIISCTNFAAQEVAKELLAQSRIMINHLPFLGYHRVDPPHSPLLASARVNDINSINLSMYFNYPQPWIAMVYDLAHHLDQVHTMNGIPFVIDPLE